MKKLRFSRKNYVFPEKTTFLLFLLLLLKINSFFKIERLHQNLGWSILRSGGLGFEKRPPLGEAVDLGETVGLGERGDLGGAARRRGFSGPEGAHSRTRLMGSQGGGLLLARRVGGLVLHHRFSGIWAE